jgi:hypothetical protein
MWQGDVRDVEPWNPCGRPLRERYSPGETKDKAKDQLFYIDGSPYSTVEVLNFETILRRFPNLLLITFAISVGSSAACTVHVPVSFYRYCTVQYRTVVVP